MADEAIIINGSFKGIPIAIDSGSIEGGRKVAVKQFPSRDTQTVEDLGLRPRKYALEIIISDKVDQDYFSYRDKLIAALESKGAGELIHPLYGRITDVVAVSYSLNENFGSFGDTTISVNFEVNENTGIPQASLSAISQISASNDVVQSSIASDIEDGFTVTASFAGNFSAAVDKVNEVIDAAKDATSFVGEAAQNLNEITAEIGELSANVNSLVSDPLALSQSITSLFDSINGLFASANATFDTFTGFFDFGSDDALISSDTVGRVERLSNNDILNGAVSGAALGYAYLAISRIDFETTREIEELAAQLDDQYILVQENGSSQAVKDAVTELRVNALEALDQAKVNASQIITIQTTTTTARLLAFSLYGNDTQGQAIVDLNGFTDVSFIEGDVEVLTA